MYEIIIPIDPIAKARPRLTRRGIAYTPRRTKDFEQICKFYMAKHFNRAPFDEPIWMNMTFIISRPKKPKYDLPIGRPDLDNYIKAIMDSANQALVTDDSRIVMISASKSYSSQHGTPGCIIIKFGAMQSEDILKD